MAGENKVNIFTDTSDAKTTEQITVLLVGLILLGAIATGILNFIDNLDLGAAGGIWDRIVTYFLLHIWPFWKFFAAVISTLAFGGIIYNSWKLNAINLAEKTFFSSLPVAVIASEEKIMDESKKKKWEKILEYIDSDNSSDWRLAIIEADIMLEETLRERGFVGESLGEILKSMKQEDLMTLDDAWEAHKVRNTIAHSGADFQLNEREARHVITLFENIFKELGAI